MLGLVLGPKGFVGRTFLTTDILEGSLVSEIVVFSQTKWTLGCRTVLHSGKAEGRCNSLSQDTLALTHKIFSSDV